MAERIDLEVPATEDALASVRSVLAGLCARLDYSYEDLDDLITAAEALLYAAMREEAMSRLVMDVTVAGLDLHVGLGEFTSPRLRERVLRGAPDCLDLRTLLVRTVDEVRVREGKGQYRVVLSKRHGGLQA